jgi:alkylation response protein AidB-like acyl-CoA dehydrogenase
VPDPTPAELIERAIELRPLLIADQAAAEERSNYSPEMHERFQEAGFYRMFVPKRYGGLEVDVPTFMRVAVEIARGCPSTAWCLALASNHALMAAPGSRSRRRTRSSATDDSSARRSHRRSPRSPRRPTASGSSAAESRSAPGFRTRPGSWARR